LRKRQLEMENLRKGAKPLMTPPPPPPKRQKMMRAPTPPPAFLPERRSVARHNSPARREPPADTDARDAIVPVAQEQFQCSVHGKMRSLQNLVEDGRGGYRCTADTECHVGPGPPRDRPDRGRRSKSNQRALETLRARSARRERGESVARYPVSVAQRQREEYQASVNRMILDYRLDDSAIQVLRSQTDFTISDLRRLCTKLNRGVMRPSNWIVATLSISKRPEPERGDFSEPARRQKTDANGRERNEWKAASHARSSSQIREASQMRPPSQGYPPQKWGRQDGPIREASLYRPTGRDGFNVGWSRPMRDLRSVPRSAVDDYARLEDQQAQNRNRSVTLTQRRGMAPGGAHRSRSRDIGHRRSPSLRNLSRNFSIVQRQGASQSMARCAPSLSRHPRRDSRSPRAKRWAGERR